MSAEVKFKMGVYLSVFATWVTTIHNLVPDQIEIVSVVALMFGVVDYITGVVASALKGKLSSTEARKRTVAKMAQFFALVSLGAGTSALTATWIWYGAAWSGIVTIEAMSILENTIRLERQGAKLGPIRPFLNKLSAFFRSTADKEL